MFLGKWTPSLIQEAEWSRLKPISTLYFPWPLWLVERWESDSNTTNEMSETFKGNSGELSLALKWERCENLVSCGVTAGGSPWPRKSQVVSWETEEMGSEGHHLSPALSLPSFSILSVTNFPVLLQPLWVGNLPITPLYCPIVSTFASPSLPLFLLFFPILKAMHTYFRKFHKHIAKENEVIFPRPHNSQVAEPWCWPSWANARDRCSQSYNLLFFFF